MKKILTTFILLTLCFQLIEIKAQPTGKALEIVKLINEARTNPKDFLIKYKTEIQKYEPKFISILEKSVSVPKVIWDNDLARMAKVYANGDLNPEYKGSNTICGFSSGKESGSSSNDALYYVCDFYTNVNNSDYAYIGLFHNQGTFCFYWGQTCDRQKNIFVFEGKVDSSSVNFKTINTAVGQSYLSAMDIDMVRELNFVRHYPAVYAQIISQYLHDKSQTKKGLSKDIYDAGIELIEELKAMKPAQLLYPKECVYNAAKAHGVDCKKRGFLDHLGSDDSDPWDRISKQCKNLTGNENLVGGVDSDGARGMVISLLLDDGISSRGHRKNILDPEWKYVGCYGYVQEKNQYYTLMYYVQNFAKEN